MNKNNTILIAIIALLVGVIIGYGFNSTPETKDVQVANGMHRMPDGSMMQNVGMDMDDMMQGMMTGLQGKTGDAFDKAFLEEMIVHHEGAVDMAELVLSTSKRPELLKLANDIISAQTKEIEMMKSWEKAWFNK